MAQKEQKRRFYNRIKILVVMLILAGITLHGAGGGIASALGLEQAARCGMEEHIHDEEACYVGTVLTCSKKMHVHSERCYLLLLEDNDINWLLDVVDSTENNTLEAAIDSAVSQAMTLNSVSSENPANEKSADPETQLLSVEIKDEPIPLSSAKVSQLNTVISENGIAPALVLNENLSTAADIGQTSAAMPLALGGQSGGDVSVLAVGGSASTDTRAINFYINLDGVITFINSGMLENFWYDYYSYYSYENTVAAYTDVVVTALTTGNINSTYFFRYNTDGSTTTFDNNATYQFSWIHFGNTNNARYSILSTRTGSGSWQNPYTYTPVDFYTVTLDYSAVDAENRIQYVQKGEDSTLTLSDEYLWVDKNGKEADAAVLEGIIKAYGVMLHNVAAAAVAHVHPEHLIGAEY